MSTYIDKPISLIERKKQQWAKEREELDNLNGPWRSIDSQNNFEQPFGRSRYDSKFSMVNNNDQYFRRDLSETNRRSSLPPLYKNQYNSNNERYERDKDFGGGETSGYASDNPNPSEYNRNSGYESSSSFRDDRPKWGDKGVGVGKFWQPKQDSFDTKVTNEPPNWVKRGLQDGEILVSNTSPAESPQQTYEEQERPCSGSSSSLNRTHIRGQNIPIDSVELAERERRRLIALEHQEAIRQQLADREKRRREERDKRIQEEREEELRIEKEQEVEKQRKELEQKVLHEKMERERKRNRALQEAVELAEKEAKLDKMKKRMMKQININEVNMSENIKDEEETVKSNIQTTEAANNTLDKNKIIEVPSEELDNSASSKPIEIKNNLQIVSPRDLNSNKHEMLNNVLNNNLHESVTPIPSATTTDNMALIFQNPIEALPNLHYALLLPTSSGTSGTIPIALPIATLTQTDRESTTRTENRILTPTQYRNRNRKVCDSSTQTENLDQEKYLPEKNTNLELTYDNRTNSRKERRSRNEDRKSEIMEERPKWNANRPPTRYLKQSEKDPLYQRKKMRQKIRDTKTPYDDKNSSDESQMASPRSYRKKGYIEKRHMRALWRKNDQVFARNVRMYQTEIIPLESDKDQIYYKKIEHDCCCHCRCDRHKYREEKVDILKIEHSPRDSYELENKLLPDNLNENNNEFILDKLNALHTGLLMKQEQWENSPRTPLISSNRH